MPTPLDILISTPVLIFLGIWGALIIIEALFPGRKLASSPGWRWRSLSVLFIYLILSSYLPLMVDEFLASHRLFDLTHLGTGSGALVALLIYQLGAYAYHRSIHKFDFLWRYFHQMHHSAERVDAWGAFYFSPLDAIGWTLVTSFTLVFLIGVSPASSQIVLLSLIFTAVFQHSNIKTPQWLGYIIQRPESHSLHHGRGVHQYNYADIPLIDILFGTFKNPKDFVAHNGFYDGASARIFSMVRGLDISLEA